MSYARSLFIFRRDLRLDDNTALIRAMKVSRQVITAFIFDPRQCEPHDYFSPNAFEFLQQSLADLQRGLVNKGGRLNLYYGLAEDVVPDLVTEHKIEAVFWNRDYTPFSSRRDAALRQRLGECGCVCEELHDALLSPPGSVYKDAGGPYTVFTPFYRKALSQPAPLPVASFPEGMFWGGVLQSRHSFREGQLGKSRNPQLAFSGGRDQAIKILGSLLRLKNYSSCRDIPALAATSGLSAHLKFGTLSVREAHAAISRVLGGDHPLIRQLYWRDFFTHIAWHFPHVFTGAFYPEYDAIHWENREDFFLAWCEGRTGFPLVDAGMRELNTTGFMHNRCRMVTASFLVKDLHIDWRKGERYFASRLLDYDPALNNGNWQWAASTGCDHQPYFRIFNPWLQQTRFDPEAKYIKKWLPELGNLAPVDIHDPLRLSRSGYCPLLVDHALAKQWAQSVFREISRRGTAIGC